jgi:exonuclease III
MLNADVQCGHNLDPTICCLQETHLTNKDTHKLEAKGWENNYHACRNQKKAGVVILISDKADFMQLVSRDKEGHYILIKGTAQQL